MKLSGNTGKARSLRRQLTLLEVLLWQQLRTRPGGNAYRRQHPAGPYVLDFFCARRNLAIEVDGEAHNRGDRPERDIIRDRSLIDQGIRVLRISATDVLNDLEGVLRLIAEQCRGG